MKVIKALIGLGCTFFALQDVYAAATLSIKVQGVSQEIATNIERRLLAEKQTYGKRFNQTAATTLNNQAADIAKDAMEPFGYFHALVRSGLQHSKPDNYVINLHIKPGIQNIIQAIEVKITGPGANDKAIVDFMQHFPLKKGQPFLVPAYNNAKEELFQVANEAGYIKATIVENKILINRDTNTTKIILYMNTGVRYYFGAVTFDESPYSATFLKRFVPFTSEQPFSSQQLIDLQQALAGSYYFQQAVVSPDFEHIRDQHVPVTITTTAPKAKRYSLGLGYGTFTGPRLSAGLNWRRITDDGQHFDAQLRLSKVLAGFAGKYYIPGNDPLNEEWILGIGFQKFTPQNGDSFARNLSFGYSKKYGDWRGTANLNYLNERYKVFNQPTRNSELLYPSLNLSYLHADNTINPQSGRSLSLNLQGSSSDILSTTSFLQGEVKGKLLMSPFDFAKVILRTDIGYTVVHDIKDLPLSMYFFAGGLNSIRGYTENSIGPGKYLAVGSVEYRNRLYGNLSGAVFYDVGTATDHFGQTSLSRGRGIGLVYESVIGPIKLYGAEALSKKTRPRKIEFSIGPEF